MGLNTIIGFAILCILFLIYTSYVTPTSVKSIDDSKSSLIDDYNKKINTLENNLAEISLKIASLNSSDSNTTYSESVLTKYKEDIGNNMKEILLQLKSYVPKDIYEQENNRVNLLLEQYKNNNDINSGFVEKYSKEVKDVVNKIADIESKWTKMESDMFVELDGKMSVNKLSELKQEIMSNVNSITKEAADNVKREAVDIINKSLENIDIGLKDTTKKVEDTIISLGNVLENNRINTKDIELFKQSMYEKLTSYETESKNTKMEIANVKEDLVKSINDFISLNTSRTKSIEDKLAVEISANATAFLEIKNSLSNVISVIGDVGNLKYTPMLKNNVIDALYDLNSRLSALEVKSKDIDALKSSVNVLMNSLIKQPDGFWDYHYVTNSVAYTMNELKKKLDNTENKDSPFYIDLLSKYKSIVSKFNYAYVNINNGGKAIIQLSIMQAVDELKYLVDRIFYTTEDVTSIKISQEEYSLYTKEIDNAKKEIAETQKELVTADYIKNLQLSVNRLHKKSSISEEDVSKLKGDLESLNISTSIKNEGLVKSLEELKTSVSKLTISDNKINELDNVIKGLQANALDYYYTTNTVKAMEQTVQSLNNWAGSRGDYFGDDNLTTYIKNMDEKIRKNKESDDSINLSLDKLKKLVGEFTLASDTSVGDIAMKARDEAARIKAVLGLYDWNKNGGKSVSESLDNIASKIINIETTLNNLNPSFISSQTTSLLDTTTYLMDSFAKLTQEDKDIRTIISSLSADNTYINNYYFDLFKNTIGMPKRSETVYAILDRIDAELKVLKDKGVQSDNTLSRIINMENKYTESLNYTIRVNNYVTEVEKKVVESKVLIDNLSSDLIKLKTEVDTQNARLTNYEKLQTDMDLLKTTVTKVEADLEWRSIIYNLEEINKYKLYMKNYVPLEKYNSIESKIQGIIDNVKLISIQTYARSNEKFYKEYTDFNNLIMDVYNNHISILTKTVIGNDELYTQFWKDLGSKLAFHVNITEYGNTRDTRWNEPLWQYTQRKVGEIFSSLSNITSKLNIFESNDKDLSLRINTVDTKLDSQISSVNDNITSSIKPLNDSIIISLDKIREFDSKFISVDNKFIEVDTKINELSNKLDTSKVGSDLFNGKSPDLQIPSIALNPLNITQDVYFICRFTVTNGVVSDGTIDNRLNDKTRLGMTATQHENVLNFSDFYKMILSGPANMSFIGNRFEHYTATTPASITLGRGTDNNTFIANLINIGRYTRAPSISTTIATGVFSSNMTGLTTITHNVTNIGSSSTPYTPRRPEIITIINSLIEFSRTTSTRFCFQMGITYNLFNVKAILAAGSVIKGYSSRLYLDTAKSFVNATPTIISDSLLDVSEKGIILNGNAINVSPFNYDSSTLNSGTDTTNMCPTNSYMCGINYSYASQQFKIHPRCCSFRN